MRGTVLAALSWEPQIKGALYVVTAILILVGSCYLLLATNVGARLGFLLAGAGLFGWLATLGMIWWGYGRGPQGPAPSWKSQGVVVGDLSAARSPALVGFPKGWEKLDFSDKEVADATPTADGILAPAEGNGPFKGANEYVVVAVHAKGGERHGILGLNFRPFNVLHKPHYLVIQVQPATSQPNPAGGLPKLVPTPGAPPVSVVLLRDLGAKRLHPAVFTIACSLAFGLFCYQLHVRDKEAAARRAAEAASGAGSGRLQPVPR